MPPVFYFKGTSFSGVSLTGINMLQCMRRQIKCFRFKIALTFKETVCVCTEEESEILLAYLGSLIAAEGLKSLQVLGKKLTAWKLLPVNLLS